MFNLIKSFYYCMFSHFLFSFFNLGLITQSMTEIKDHHIGGGLVVESGGNMTTLDGEWRWKSGGYLIRQEK